MENDDLAALRRPDAIGQFIGQHIIAVRKRGIHARAAHEERLNKKRPHDEHRRNGNDRDLQ
jgi:hypothetical protein